MRRLHQPPRQRTCQACGHVVHGGFGSGLYFQRYGDDAPCSQCGGRLSTWEALHLPPLWRRSIHAAWHGAVAGVRRRVDRVRRRLYL